MGGWAICEEPRHTMVDIVVLHPNSQISHRTKVPQPYAGLTSFHQLILNPPIQSATYTPKPAISLPPSLPIPPQSLDIIRTSVPMTRSVTALPVIPVWPASWAMTIAAKTQSNRSICECGFTWLDPGEFELEIELTGKLMPHRS